MKMFPRESLLLNPWKDKKPRADCAEQQRSAGKIPTTEVFFLPRLVHVCVRQEWHYKKK